MSDEYVESEREAVARSARENLARYRGDRPAPSLDGKAICIVDDGVATGSTAITACRLVREQVPGGSS